LLDVKNKTREINRTDSISKMIKVSECEFQIAIALVSPVTLYRSLY
jgi:hypothetical protein